MEKKQFNFHNESSNKEELLYDDQETLDKQTGFNIFEDDSETREEKKNTYEDSVKDVAKRKKEHRNKIIIFSVGLAVFNIIVFVFALILQRKVSLMTVTNALWFAGIFDFTASWMIFVYNKNIFSPLAHGFKTFGLMLIGRRPKEDYYTYFKRVEENQVDKLYIKIFLIFTGVILVPGIILLFFV